MRRHFFTLLICCALTASLMTACGGGEEKKTDLDKLADAADDMGKAAQEMGESARDMAASSEEEHEPQPAVSFKVLMDYLPGKFGNLERSEPEGESMTMGNWTYSEATVKYNGADGQHADVQIFDYAYIPTLYSSFQIMWKMNYNRESSKGYERTTKIGGYPAVEQWTKDDQNAEVSVLVGERFIVAVKTDGLPEGAARELLGMIDMKALAKEKSEKPS